MSGYTCNSPFWEEDLAEQVAASNLRTEHVVTPNLQADRMFTEAVPRIVVGGLIGGLVGWFIYQQCEKSLIKTVSIAASIGAGAVLLYTMSSTSQVR